MRTLVAFAKTILTVVVVAGMVIASFYFAYLLLVLVVVIAVGTLAWWHYNRDQKVVQYRYEDLE